jgi:hypothetical protein
VAWASPKEPDTATVRVPRVMGAVIEQMRAQLAVLETWKVSRPGLQAYTELLARDAAVVMATPHVDIVRVLLDCVKETCVPTGRTPMPDTKKVSGMAEAAILALMVVSGTVCDVATTYTPTPPGAPEVCEVMVVPVTPAPEIVIVGASAPAKTENTLSCVPATLPRNAAEVTIPLTGSMLSLHSARLVLQLPPPAALKASEPQGWEVAAPKGQKVLAAPHATAGA